ncbi:RING-type E3 ubiquitin transferase [Sarracenia purpurea var. burkii]
MASGYGESTSRPPQSPSCSNSNGNNNDAGNFECNICFELAQDPIVTLCGHLFCWPCLYKWLHIHSHSQECPVCKGLIEEEKLVPLYGRGKNSTDPRSRSIPGIHIPNRPSGQRPGTAPPPDTNHFSQHGFGFMGGYGGFAPTTTARIGNFTLSAAFGGLIPSLFNLQVHQHGFPDTSMHGAAAGFPYAYSHPFHGGHAHGFPQHANPQGQQADYLKMVFLMVGVFVVLALILN